MNTRGFNQPALGSDQYSQWQNIQGSLRSDIFLLLFITQGHIEPTLAYITTIITETTHTHIHSLEHSTT